MQITTNTPQLKFTSRLNRIPPSVIRTVKGDIKIYEATAEEINRKGFAQNLMQFFCQNQASISEHPVFKIFHQPDKSQLGKKFVNILALRFKNEFKYDDGNFTLLLAKDKNNNLCGACLSFSYDEVPLVQKTTCYLDAIAVSHDYRGMKLGKTMVDKTVQSAKNSFSDIFLLADAKALGFYKALGFKELNENSKVQKKIIDYISKYVLNGTYPKYTRLCTIALQQDKPRWYETLAPEIDKINRFYRSN